ncbi:MAG: ABC transporter permease [Alphaproteobacteria bacterium]|nr:ABC transporter permease [Alphaproteobacteria bacterium]
MVDGTYDETPEAEADGQAEAIAAHRRRNRLGPIFWIPLVWIVFVVLLAVLAPSLGLQDPADIDFLALQAPPNEDHVLGTDVLGRDILARIVYGARVSLTVGVAAPLIGLVLGLMIGIMAGYYRGWTDEIIGTAIDTWLAVPGLVILLLFSVIFGGSLPTVCIGLGLLFIPAAARITRATTMNFANREFVLAARAMGASDLRILALEIFPNIVWPLVAYILIAIPIAVVIEGALSFLGLSVASPTPSWGGMIAEGREHLEETPHISLIPTAVMFVTVLSFNLVGDTVRRRLADLRDRAI